MYRYDDYYYDFGKGYLFALILVLFILLCIISSTICTKSLK
ncbi:MAG: hypothetical protein K0Q49_1094 [Haloplasmataceae bacterium]|jgi:uncharacterized protein (TIGR01732 family)|nr:hypothetical protein [Haloplasmataceae bacterium]